MTFKKDYWKKRNKARKQEAAYKPSSSRVGGPESRQAPSTNELDKDPELGYYGNCVRGPDAELKQHQKRPATRSSGSSRRGLNSQTTSSQDEERKPSSSREQEESPQAKGSSLRPKSTSSRIRDPE